MKNKILLIFLFVEIFSATLLAQSDKIIAIKKQINTGNFIEATAQINHLLCRSDIDFETRQALMYELELMNRINIEFSLTEKDVKKRLSDLFPNVSENQLKAWQQSGKLEMRTIDNQKKYFNRAVGNLFLLDSVAKVAKAAKYGKSKDNVSTFCERYIPELITKKQTNGTPFDHKKIKITYSITLPANTLPANETVRCRLPFPHEDGKFVKVSNFKTSDSTYIVTDKKDFHTSIYFENAKSGGLPLKSYQAQFGDTNNLLKKSHNEYHIFASNTVELVAFHKTNHSIKIFRPKEENYKIDAQFDTIIDWFSSIFYEQYNYIALTNI
jgi:hypothetical protein